MSLYKLLWKAQTKEARIIDSTDAIPIGFNVIDEFFHDHEELDPNDLAFDVNHVFYHHVRDALYHIGELDMQAVTILDRRDDDLTPIFPGPLPGAAVFAVTGASVRFEGTSGNTYGFFNITMLGDRSVVRSIDWEFLPGLVNPVSADDIVGGFRTGTITWYPTDSDTKQVIFEVVGDKQIELDETLRIHILNPTGPNATILNAYGTAIIKNDDFAPLVPRLEIEIIRSSQEEGDTGFKEWLVKITRSNNLALLTTISIGCFAGPTPSADQFDFKDDEWPMANFIFLPNQSQKNWAFYTRGDTTIEQNEKFYVRLFNFVGSEGVTGKIEILCTLIDDDSPTNEYVYLLSPVDGAPMLLPDGSPWIEG